MAKRKHDELLDYVHSMQGVTEEGRALKKAKVELSDMEQIIAIAGDQKYIISSHFAQGAPISMLNISFEDGMYRAVQLVNNYVSRNKLDSIPKGELIVDKREKRCFFYWRYNSPQGGNFVNVFPYFDETAYPRIENTTCEIVTANISQDENTKKGCVTELLGIPVEELKLLWRCGMIKDERKGKGPVTDTLEFIPPHRYKEVVDKYRNDSRLKRIEMTDKGWILLSEEEVGGTTGVRDMEWEEKERQVYKNNEMEIVEVD